MANGGYSFWKGLWKSALPTIIVGLPLLVQLLPVAWQNLTLSGVVLLILNWLKVRYGVKVS